MTHRHVAALVADHRSGLEEVHGLLDLVLKRLGLTPEYGSSAEGAKLLYRLREIEDGPFLPGRCVAVDVYPAGDVKAAKQMGVMGVIHPDVLANHSVPMPCALFEISMEPALGWLPETEMSLW
eukprot:Protomagalhaensia_wolfi_Nauph_80__4567@NODE_46_length_4258_cov_300_005452_g37_i0_p5_GENE_NODE_46_length_4258_cov_300_005452_g37_i0NODE_46_length_4258_cov_300_005452_g37_i0_p5_ORF_typecomplete_len123_score27_76tRNA_synthFbeta/PF17759_1/6_2e19_NODE_46_length_4258_cov_300_005452_g37_i034003768